MDSKNFSSLAALAGLDMSAEHAAELHDYVRQLFASLKPGRDTALEEGGKSSDRVGRIFGRVRSIEELDLSRIEPAIHFSPRVKD